MDFINDDENVKAMRDTAREIGLTDLLMGVRRDLVDTLNALDRQWERVNTALELLGVPKEGGKK